MVNGGGDCCGGGGDGDGELPLTDSCLSVCLCWHVNYWRMTSVLPTEARERALRLRAPANHWQESDVL